MKEEVRNKINEAADGFVAKDAAACGVTAEEVRESAERMKDPEYRKKIHDFAKECFKKEA